MGFFYAILIAFRTLAYKSIIRVFVLFCFILFHLTNSPNAIIGGSTGRNQSEFEKWQDIIKFKGHNTWIVNSATTFHDILTIYSTTQIRKSKKLHFYSRWMFNVTVNVRCWQLVCGLFYVYKFEVISDYDFYNITRGSYRLRSVSCRCNAAPTKTGSTLKN